MSELIITPPEGIESNSIFYRWLYKIYLRIQNCIWMQVDLGGNTFSIPNNSATTVQYSEIVADTIGGWNSSTYSYTCQSGGPHTVAAKARLSGTLAAGKRFAIAILVNGVAIAESQIGNVALIDPDLVVLKDINLRKGDVVSVQAFQDTGGALNLYGTTKYTYLTIKRIN